MINRYVIALNRLKIAVDQVASSQGENLEGKLSLSEVAKLMDVVRKYPEEKINYEDLFTCGFSTN